MADNNGTEGKNILDSVIYKYSTTTNQLEEENRIDFDDLLARATEKINQMQGDCELEILGESRKIKDIKAPDRILACGNGSRVGKVRGHTRPCRKYGDGR